MIISHKYKFIFLEYPKTGTLSMSTVLRRHHPEINWVRFENHKKEKARIRHSGLKDALIQHPECSNYFKFAFVRNPWDRAVSLKYHLIYSQKYREMEFSKYIPSMHFKAQPTFYQFCEKNYENLDFIGKYENLEEDFKNVCNIIGLEKMKKLHHLNKRDNEEKEKRLIKSLERRKSLTKDEKEIVNLEKKINESRERKRIKKNIEPRDYREYYDDETRQIVAEKYAKDIEYFNYKF